MTSPDTPPTNESMGPAIAALGRLQIVAEATVGYRFKLVEGGISDAVADQMAKDFHDTMLGLLKNGLLVAQKAIDAAASRAAQPKGWGR